MSATSYDLGGHASGLPHAAPIELGWRWAEAFNRRDADALVELADPNIAFYPTRLLGGHGPYVGHDRLRRWVADITQESPLSEQITDVRNGQPGHVVALGRVLAHGEPISPFAMWIELRDSRVVEARAYLSGEAEMERIGRIPT